MALIRSAAVSCALAARSRTPALLAALLAACTSSGVGDYCVPDQAPPDGFDAREVYLETSSVQCRTRACMVYQLDGEPPISVARNHSFCTCRCAGQPQGEGLPLCDCGDGFRCLEEDEQGFVTLGPPVVQGGYCVPCIDGPDDPRGLDPAVFRACDG